MSKNPQIKFNKIIIKSLNKDFEEYFIKMDDCDRQEIAVSIECPWCHKKIHVKDEYKKNYCLFHIHIVK